MIYTIDQPDSGLWFKSKVISISSTLDVECKLSRRLNSQMIFRVTEKTEDSLIKATLVDNDYS